GVADRGAAGRRLRRRGLVRDVRGEGGGARALDVDRVAGVGVGAADREEAGALGDGAGAGSPVAPVDGGAVVGGVLGRARGVAGVREGGHHAAAGGAVGGEACREGGGAGEVEVGGCGAGVLGG